MFHSKRRGTIKQTEKGHENTVAGMRGLSRRSEVKDRHKKLGKLWSML